MKVCNIPVKPYLAKFVEKASHEGWLIRSGVRFTENDELKFSARLPFTMHERYELPRNYFANLDPDMVFITVYMHQVNIRTMYHLVQWLKSEFQKEMFTYTRMGLEFGQFAKPSIEAFLRKCEITDDDYNLETAHRAWLRYNKKLKLKRKNTAA